MNDLKISRGQFLAFTGLAFIVVALSVAVVWCVMLLFFKPEPKSFVIDPSDIPTTVGVWQGKPDSDNTWGLDRGLGSVTVRYTNLETGDRLSAIVLIGKPQHVCEHSFYRSYYPRRFTQNGDMERTRVTFDGERADLHRANFNYDSADGEKALRIHWSWWIDGRWEAPGVQDVRMRTADMRGPIGKIYLVTESSTPDNVEADFLADFLPALNEVFARKLAPE